MVPNVIVEENSIYVNGNIVTLTLSWGEPLNGCDAIVNYTVLCSGNVTCPPNLISLQLITLQEVILSLT